MLFLVHWSPCPYTIPYVCNICELIPSLYTFRGQMLGSYKDCFYFTIFQRVTVKFCMTDIICIMLKRSAWAAITKFHRPRGLNSLYLFFTVLDWGTRIPSEASSTGMWLAPTCFVFTGPVWTTQEKDTLLTLWWGCTSAFFLVNGDRSRRFVLILNPAWSP